MKNICFQMTNRKAWIVMLFALCLAFPALAQKITVQGTVVDQAGEPLIGASVLTKGTAQGSATDYDGHFTIEVSPKATLVVSYVGYSSQEVPVDGRTTIKVTLKENSKVLDEVVAIGYGTVKKNDATGSVSAIKPSEIQAGLSTSVQNLLVGQTPGVVVTTNGGQPEGSASIRIRGGASLNANNDPLVVIDGVPMDTKGTLGSSNPLSLVSPENIESMTVLKSASATAIFGSRASNGVIIITTKSGKSGRPQVNFTANMYVNTPRNYVDMMSADEFRSYIKNEYGESSSQYGALGNANTDWQKEVLRTSVSSDYSLSVGGTAGFLPYRVSGTYTANNGIVNTTKMDRATLGINLTPKFFHDLLSVNANVKGAYIKNHFFDSGALGSSISFNPTLPVYAEGGNVFNNYTTYVGTTTAGPTSAGETINTQKAINPVALINDNISNGKVWQSVGNLQFDLKMPFLTDLRANLNLGYDASKSDVRTITAENSPMAWKNGNEILVGDAVTTLKDGAATTKNEHQSKYNLLLDFYLNYQKDLKEISSNLDLTAGYSWQKFHREGWNCNVVASGTNFGVQARPTYYYASQNQLVSFWGRLNYSLLDRYLFTATVRDDGTSRFSKDNRWGVFPSAAFAWKVINEPWMKATKSVLNDLKLRLDWGITGQQDIGDDFFPYLPVYMVGTGSYTYPSVTGGNGWTTVIKANGYNTNIKWESTTTWNAGLDIAFLNNRINASFDIYKRKTKDLISYVDVDAGSNLTNKLNSNIGNLENKGFEFNLTVRPVVTKDFTWTSSYNIAVNKNKITYLTKSDDPNYFVPVGSISVGTGSHIQAQMVGHAANSFYVYEQVYDNSGNPIEGQFVDRNKNGVIDDGDRMIYHSPDPKVVMAWNNTVNYKNWDFGMSLRANFGNYVYDNTLASNDNKAANTSVPLSNLMNNTFLFKEMTVKQAMSSYFVRNASFLRCDNITLGYTCKGLVQNQLRLRIYGAVQNPFVITNYKGLDPEVFGGIDNAVYPRPVTFTLGVVAQF